MNKSTVEQLKEDWERKYIHINNWEEIKKDFVMLK